MIKFYAIDSQSYGTLSNKRPEDLFFLTDTKQLMKGTVQYNNAIEVVSDELPTTSIALGKLYIKVNEDSHASISYHNGTSWVELVPEIYTDDSGDSGSLMTKGAIADYVALQMSGFGGDLLNPVQSRNASASEYEEGDRTLDSIDFVGEEVNKGDMVLVENLGTLYYFSDIKPKDEDVDGLNTIVPSNLPDGTVGCWKKMLTATVYDMGNGVTTNGNLLQLNVDSNEFTFNDKKLAVSNVSSDKISVNGDSSQSNLTSVLNVLDANKMPKATSSDSKHVATINDTGNAIATEYTMGTTTLSEDDSGTVLATETAIIEALTWKTTV